MSWLYPMCENGPFVSGSDIYCLSSTVSSRIVGTIAKMEGFNFVVRLPSIHDKCSMCQCMCIAAIGNDVNMCHNYLTQETLTGFKWMGNKACDLMKQGKTVLFAFEEAIGRRVCVWSNIGFPRWRRVWISSRWFLSLVSLVQVSCVALQSWTKTGSVQLW